MLSNVWNWIYRFKIYIAGLSGLTVVIHTVKGARGRALLQGNSVETTLEIWSWQFQWRNLCCCWLPGRPLYPFVPLACLSMSLISWEKIVKGVLPNPPIPHSTSTHTHTHSHLHSLCIRVRVEGLPLPCFLADYQVHFNYSRSIHFWLERGGQGKLDRLKVWLWLQSNGLTLICISSFTSGMGLLPLRHNPQLLYSSYAHSQDFNWKASFWEIASLSAWQGEGSPVIYCKEGIKASRCLTLI